MYKKKIKRYLDIILALISLIIFSPVMLIVAIGIKFDSAGPIIFKQKRIGKNLKPFNIYKFRSMYHNVKFGENKATKFGEFIRRTSLDEIPQLINILKGEMSFIGPRPWMLEYSHYFTKNEKRRSEVLPGLSGWAQIQGRNGISIKEKIDADIWYVKNICLWIDIKIFLKTILFVFRKTNNSITENGIQNELEYLKENYKRSNIKNNDKTEDFDEAYNIG